mmetsp:Transcript_15598/g.33831  ORF Transcript_15598/g.33831 Transcript_15598/m.33831 type:complete len:81 (-) Transcript_15598:1565-1807(-)
MALNQQRQISVLFKQSLVWANLRMYSSMSHADMLHGMVLYHKHSLHLPFSIPTFNRHIPLILLSSILQAPTQVTPKHQTN